MASETPVAVRFLGLVPTLQGFDKHLSKELSGSKVTSAADRGGRSIGSRLISGVSKTMKVGAVAAGGAIAGVLGTAIYKGFGRLTAIENAEAKLTGLGHSADTVKAVMNDALASVKGTAYGLDEAAGLAGTLVASGIKPGKELQKTLSLVGDSATIAGRGLDDMGLIWGSVAAKGKLQGDDAMQLLAAGIPIWQMVGDVMGVTAGEAQELGSKGQVSFEIFQKAMEQGVGGAALKSGNTTVGAFKNMGAALSRFGATLLKGVFPLIGPFFNQITSLLDGAAAAVEPWLARIQPVLEGAATRLLGYTSTFTDSIGGMLEVLKTGDFDPTKWAEGITEDSPLVDFTFRVRDGFLAMRDAIGGIDWSVITGFLSPIVDGFKALAPVLLEAWTNLSPLGLALDILKPVLPEIGTAIGQLAQVLAGVLGGALAAVLPAISQLVGALGPLVAELLSHVLPAVISVASGIGAALVPVIQALGPLLSTVVSAVTPIIGRIVAIVGPLISTLARVLVPVLVGVGVALGGLIRFLTPIIGLLVRFSPIIVGVVGAFIAYQKVMGAIRLVALLAAASQTTFLGAISAATLGVVRQRIATVASNVAQKAMAIGTKAAAAAQWLWNAALSANPIGLVIAGIILLVGALVLFFTKTELGRKIWDAVWGAIKSTAAGVATWFMGTVVPLFAAAWEWIRSAAAVVADWFTGTLVPVLQAAWAGIAAGATWLYQNVIQPVWYAIKLAIVIVITAVLAYVDLLKWYWTNLLAPAALWLYGSVILPVWNAIQTAISAVVTWMVTVGWPLLKSAWDAVAGAAQWLYGSVILPVWNAILAAISAVVTWFQTVAWPIINTVIGWLQMSFEGWKILAGIVWSMIQSAISAVVTWFQTVAWPIISTVIGWLKMSFEGWKLLAQLVWSAILTAISVVVSWFRDTAWPAVRSVIDSLKSGFEGMRDKLRDVWDAVKTRIIDPVVSWFRDTVAPLISNITDGIKRSFETMRDGVAAAWEAVKEKAKAPIKFVVETVVRDGIVKNFNSVASKFGVKEIDLKQFSVGFRSGGILPGFSRMRDGDDQLVPMRRGEGVLVSEGLRDRASKALFLMANAAAKRGVSFASFLAGGMGAGPGFAGGGILDKFKDLGGDALDYIKAGAKFVADVVADPTSTFKKLAEALTSKVPGGELIRELAVAVPMRIADDIGKALMGALQTAPDAGGAPGGPPPAGTSGSLGGAAALARSMGLVMTSGYRPGARTLSGYQSLHSLNRARDFAGSAAQMMAFFNAMWPLKPTELLYSPAGTRQWNRSGRMGWPTSQATIRTHYNHVHVGYADGGIIPTLYDQGGRVESGVSVIANNTRRPETILPPDESAALMRIAKRGEKGVEKHYHYSPRQTDLDADIERHTRRGFEEMVHAAEEVLG